MNSEAATIIEKFHGARPLAAALSGVLGRRVSPSTVYRWTYPVEKGGTGGVIPTAKRRVLSQAARLHGILLDEVPR